LHYQGQHEDAAKAYLATLAQNSDANHIWSHLRYSLAELGKDDLLELTDHKSVDLFRPYFDF
jgi:hypothetical protein